MIHILIISRLSEKLLNFVETTKLFISNSIRISYLYVPGVGPLNSLFCPGGGFLYTMIVSGGRFLPPSSRVPGGWFWMKFIAALQLCYKSSSYDGRITVKSS